MARLEDFCLYLFELFMFAFCTITLVILVVNCLWILLGVFVYPERLLPWAAGIVGVFLHITTLYSQLQRLQEDLTTQLTQMLNRALRELNRLKNEKAAKEAEKTGAAFEGTKEDETFAEVASDEVRILMARNGFTFTVVISAVIGSTLVLLLVLSFLYVGYKTLVTKVDLFSAILSSGAVLLSSGGVSKWNAPEGNTSRQVDLIVGYLVEQWKKMKGQDDDGNFVYDDEADALDTLHRAVKFHQKNEELATDKEPVMRV